MNSNEMIFDRWLNRHDKRLDDLERKVAALEAARQPESVATSDFEALAKSWDNAGRFGRHQYEADAFYKSAAELRAVIARQPPTVAVAEVVGRLEKIKGSGFMDFAALCKYIDELKAKL